MRRSYQRSVAPQGVDYTLHQVFCQSRASFFACPLLDETMNCGVCAYYQVSIPPLPLDFCNDRPCGDCVFMILHPYHTSRERLHSQFDSSI